MSQSRCDATHMPHLVLILVRRLKSVDDERIKRCIFREQEFRQLPFNADLRQSRLHRQNVAKHYTVVIGSNLDRKPAIRCILEVNDHRVVVISNRAGLAHRDRVSFIVTAFTRAELAHSRPYRRLRLHFQSQHRVIDQSFVRENQQSSECHRSSIPHDSSQHRKRQRRSGRRAISLEHLPHLVPAPPRKTRTVTHREIGMKLCVASRRDNTTGGHPRIELSRTVRRLSSYRSSRNPPACHPERPSSHSRFPANPRPPPGSG